MRFFRFGYLSAYQGGIYAAVVMMFLAFILPSKGPDDTINLILTISTFLFAILAGFILTRQNSRFDNVRELLTKLDAVWKSLYHTFGLFGTKIQNKSADIIDAAYISAYDFELWNYQKAEIFGDIFSTVYEFINKLKPKTAAQKGAVEVMLNKLENIEVTEHQVGEIAKEKLMISEWAILYILSGIILFCVFYMKVFTVYSFLFTILLSTAICFVLFIIRDLNNLRLKGELLAYESGQKVFDTIDKMRYYHAEDLFAMVAPKKGKFRVGMHSPGEKPRIVICSSDEDWKSKIKTLRKAKKK
ncbi:hypothetical protein KY335_00470 [Candidatus Woesearchaeota archaeon]|nr:hypothetical protein [Candidatus Woesearchaeota archaeon]